MENIKKNKGRHSSCKSTNLFVYKKQKNDFDILYGQIKESESFSEKTLNKITLIEEIFNTALPLLREKYNVSQVIQN